MCGAPNLYVFFFSIVYIHVLILGQICQLVSERGVLSGKLRRRRQGGDGQGAEAIAMKSSPSMSESSTSYVNDGNMEASHQRAASPVANMEAVHRRVAAPVTTMRQRAFHGGALVMKA